MGLREQSYSGIKITQPIPKLGQPLWPKFQQENFKKDYFWIPLYLLEGAYST